MLKTKDPIYQDCLVLMEKQGLAKFGLSSTITWEEDPKRLTFMLSRYKFVAKMLEGYTRVLEVGCGDGFGSRIVAQHVTDLLITDYDPLFIQSAEDTKPVSLDYKCKVHDILKAPLDGKKYAAAYSLDVLEHFSSQDEIKYFGNVCQSLADNGVFIVGMPSLNSQRFANPRAKMGHINCKSLPDLKRTCKKYFKTCFGFSMNDEVVHTGFHEMANYILAVCVSPKKRS
jgi:2-polyprenyl-3-methyl-5-hydroxy-6-metoxy-1,4-benzoquinol methylase